MTLYITVNLDTNARERTAFRSLEGEPVKENYE
jgi:hypothetical protein